MPADSPLIEVRRSARRRKTVSAYRDGDRIVVLLPARTSKAAERDLVEQMVGRIVERESRLSARGPRAGDRALMARARELSTQVLGGRAQPASVRWVTNMNRRWGSCTPVDATIRLSHRLQVMPSWVIDYVLVHELAHLLVDGHGPEFWAWVDRYARTERARGYLEGVAMAAQWPPGQLCGDEPEGPDGDPSSSARGEESPV